MWICGTTALTVGREGRVSARARSGFDERLAKLRRGQARLGGVRLGLVRQGKARILIFGVNRLYTVSLVRLGEVGRGLVGSGKAWRGEEKIIKGENSENTTYNIKWFNRNTHA